jgi:glucosyl-3-phosphoglycerate synthase
MAQVDLGSRQNRHQPLGELTQMSSTVLRALARRVQMSEQEMPGRATPGVWALPRQDIYLHAVATQGGLCLDEHLDELTERPPLAQVLAASLEQDPVA